MARSSSFIAKKEEEPKKKKKQRVALLLSGGVDSSVALHLLLQDGRYDVTAFYLRIWLEGSAAVQNPAAG